MIKVLFDTNIILDIALKRESFFEDAQKLFTLIDKRILQEILLQQPLLIFTTLQKRKKDIMRLLTSLKI